MSDQKNVDNPEKKDPSEVSDPNIAVSSKEVSNIAESAKTGKTYPRSTTTSERQIKFERAQKCLENAALVSKRIKEHRKATAELLGKPFEDDDVCDTVSEMASTMSERTGYSAATDTSVTLSVQDALNIPGISESLANTLKQKELLMERIKQYKEISKRPMKTSAVSKRESSTDLDTKKTQHSTDANKLVNTIRDKENALSIMQVRMKAMETTILDLQEKINEKDQIIEAKNKATTLMSDSLSKKEKDSLILLEDTRQQMIKMQENFVNMETEWKEEKELLIKRLEEKDERITRLEDANSLLENARFEISVAHSKLVEEIDIKNKEISELNETIAQLSNAQEKPVEEKDVEEEKGSLEIANMVELTKKIELLEHLNCQIRQTNKELETKLASINTEIKIPQTASPSKKASPLPTRKSGRNTASKTKSPWSNLSSEPLPQETEKKQNKNEINKLEVLVQSLNKEILDKEYLISEKDTIISNLKTINAEHEDAIKEMRSQLREAVEQVHIGVSTEVIATPKPTFETETGILPKSVEVIESSAIDTSDLSGKLKNAKEQIDILNSEIDAANKNMIKVKSNHKLKLKQMQKTIDNFSKVSDANAEIVKLNEELHQLSQKVVELEEEKGNLQLHLVDYDSGRLTESDVYKKMVEMENMAEARLKAISVLETQKFDLVQELHELQQKNADMEDKLADMSQIHNEQVCTEIKSVQLEEQIDQLMAEKKELELVIENLKLDKGHLEGTIKLLQEEKEELGHKLEHYVQENIELTDKLEKLSTEKVSSAESIEIVESLTTQEKLELEEYNKGLVENKIGDDHSDLPISQGPEENIEKLMEQSIELHRKIDLFTQEREEVMDKMNKISSENESLLVKISEINGQCNYFQNNIDILINEKQALSNLNDELTHQIEELKRERIELMKESVEIAKPVSVDEGTDGPSVESQHDDKTSTDKGNNRTKSVKQLTKEILKLKNTIKEREAEIGDCQMKILSLEEQHQKQCEQLSSNSNFEIKVKSLIDENYQLKQELDNVKKYQDSEQQLKQGNEFLQNELQKLHQEYTTTINVRDVRIHELENLLVEYEKQIYNYGNSLQQKDKDLAEYINQITKLNDVSQKLKSTVELLEEEKAKDQNADLVKSLNKQISVFQKKLSENEDKLRTLEEEKSQLQTVKNSLENKTLHLDTELQKLQESFAEKQNVIRDLQSQQLKHTDELSNIMIQLKERDEEIHEIKLQLRKESIENEKLRTNLSEKENTAEEYVQEFKETKEKYNQLTLENEELRKQYSTMETKNMELMEKLKKFAATLKKKSAMYTELEHRLNETQKQLEVKNRQMDQLVIQVDTLPALEEKLKHAEEEMNRIQSQKVTIEQQKSQDVSELQRQVAELNEKLAIASNDVTTLKESLTNRQNELQHIKEENINLLSQIEALNNKIADHENEQKNNMNFVTKISSLEADINQKQIHVVELLSKLENQEQLLNQLQFGHDAKIQERDLYIENLETEINKYKNRIGRLEESISVMEDSRYSLERKADQLDSQLQEKHKAYAEYTSHEDTLVSRLAVLMDHDRVVEKRLHEIESENKELQYKIQHFSEENPRLRKSLADIQEYCNNLVEKASKTDLLEAELAKCQIQIRELETQLKRITHEHQTLIVQKKQDIDELESEFNIQIENAIKEKKVLNEKYEKVREHVMELEHKLQEYRNDTNNLNINIEELTRINHELMEKTSKELPPDYTEQYISEINKLNAVISNKNHEMSEVHNKMQNVQTTNAVAVTNLESKISELSQDLSQSSLKINALIEELNTVTLSYNDMQMLLAEKEKQIKHLIEKKSVTFEMNIPKTEGMIISSTIEPINAPQDLLSNISPSYFHTNKSFEQKQGTSTEEVVRDEVVLKKVCHKESELSEPQEDPFNSEEGWGLGESEDLGDVTPGMSHLNEQILQLRKENDTLRSDLDSNSNKLTKALKKLKELRAKNDMLLNELKISKQISQTSLLDSAIEDEMKINIKELEKKIEELTSDLNKEKREKDSVKKQNEVFSTANDRLTEMKEKMDNEIELWKYKFKEVNDKMSSLQWGADSKDSPDHKVSTIKAKDEKVNEELLKLENENDELQLFIEQLSSQNKDLLSQQKQLKMDIIDLKKQLDDQQLQSIKNTDANNRLLELQNNNTELCSAKDALRKELQDSESRLLETTKHIEQIQVEKESVEIQLKERNEKLMHQISELEKEIETLKLSEIEMKNKISSLIRDVEASQSKLISYEEQRAVEKTEECNNFVSSEKFLALEDYCKQLKCKFEDSNNKNFELEEENKILMQKIDDYEIQFKCNIEDAIKKAMNLETENKELKLKLKEYELHITELNAKLCENGVTNNTNITQNYEKQIVELNLKISQLNIENDQLLSTVAELRSSISSAIDQRGYEIAELWKQHLSQREADFQKTEHELRNELSTFEAKYEQLLDSVQSSSQEETNKLVVIEQVTSLQNKLQDKEEHLRNLQDKYAELMNQMDMLRSEIEDEKIILDNKLITQQEEYEKQILDLSSKNQLKAKDYEEAYKHLQTEVVAIKASRDESHQQVEEFVKQIDKLEETILDLTNQIRVKDNELEQKTHEFAVTLNQRNEELEHVRKQLLDYEKKLEDLSFEKESDLAVLRLKMHEKEDYNDSSRKELEQDKNSLLEALNIKIVECTNLNKQITDLNTTIRDHTTNITEMQSALENQELEIVTLHDEISNLRETLRSASIKVDKHVTFASDTKPGADIEQPEAALNKELFDAIPRAELDLALYMLHQRDVRCEELTMELTQLLEERDTLQLRLSDSLRSCEELKSTCKTAGLDISISSTQENVPELATLLTDREQEIVDVHKGQTSRSSSVSEPDGDKPKLQAKLSELRTVRHSRDVRLRHDSEQRQMDLRLLQRDVANLPPEAVEQLTQAHHTLSRDAQSTSTVLLNWLRGKSTPKVVHM